MATNAPKKGTNILWIFPDTDLWGSSALFTYNKNVTMDVSGHPQKEELVISLESKILNEAIETFYETYLTNLSLDVVRETYEDGTQDTITSVSSTTPKFIVLRPENVVDGSVRLMAAVAVLTGDTGSYSTANDAQADTPVEITAISAPNERIANATDLYNNYLSPYVASVTSPFKIEADSYGTVQFETAAS